MQRFYRVTFNYVDSSGSQINYSLFETKDLAMSFVLQISNSINVKDVSCDLVEIKCVSVIDLCESLHGKEGEYVTIKK